MRTSALPGAALLLVWILVSTIAVHDAAAARSAATAARAAATPAVDVLVALQQERRLALQHLPAVPGGQRSDEEALLSQRAQTDQAVSRLRTAVAGDLPAGFARLPRHRAALDAGTVRHREVFAFYGGLLDAGTRQLDIGARSLAEPVAGHGLRTAAELFRAGGRLSSAVSLGDRALASGGFNPAQHVEFAREIGGYRAAPAADPADLAPAAAAVHRDLLAGPGWRRMQELQDRLISAAPGSGAPLPDGEVWRSTGTEVTADVLAVAVEQATAAAEAGVTAANRDLLRTSSVGAAGLLVLAAATTAATRRTRALLAGTADAPAGADAPTQPTRLPREAVAGSITEPDRT